MLEVLPSLVRAPFPIKAWTRWSSGVSANLFSDFVTISMLVAGCHCPSLPAESICAVCTSFLCYLVSWETHISVLGVFGSPLGFPAWLPPARLSSELSHLIRHVALEPAVSGKPSFLTENRLCKLSFGRNFPLVNSLAQPGGFLEQGQQVQRSELYLQCCCILSLSFITCRMWVWVHSVFGLIIQNTPLEVPLTVWFKAENYKLTHPHLSLIWIHLPVGRSLNLLNMQNIPKERNVGEGDHESWDKM